MKIKTAEQPAFYEPEFNGNKKLPPEERIKIHIKAHVSNLQLAKYKRFEMEGGVTTISYDDISIARLHIGKIDNLETSKGFIKDGIALADSTEKELYDLLTEVRNWLLNIAEPLAEGESEASE